MTNDTHKIFTDFELAQIARMKNKAASLMKNTFYLKDAFLAGGCFTSFAHSDMPKDYDVFITDETAKNSMKAHATPEHFVINEDPSYWQNPMIEATLLDKRTSVQYILTKFKSRREVVDHFDMLHCCVSYVPSEDKLYISKKIIETINQRKIIPNSDKKIAHWREQKMILRGWTV